MVRAPGEERVRNPRKEFEKGKRGREVERALRQASDRLAGVDQQDRALGVRGLGAAGRQAPGAGSAPGAAGSPAPPAGGRLTRRAALAGRRAGYAGGRASR